MGKRHVILFISVLLLAIFLFSGFFKTTGFAVDDQKLLISLDIPPDQQKIEPGQNLLLEIAIRVPGGNIDQTSIVELEYSIRDLNGNLISSRKESGAIAVKESVVTNLLIPTNTEPGVYAAFVAVSYKGDIYEGSKTFEVVSSKVMPSYLAIILGIISLMIVTFLILSHFNKKVKEISRVYSSEVDKIEKKIKTGGIDISEASEKLRSQLSLLDKAYERGYISKEAYEKGRDKINKVHGNLKRGHL